MVSHRMKHANYCAMRVGELLKEQTDYNNCVRIFLDKSAQRETNESRDNFIATIDGAAHGCQRVAQNI